MTHALVDVYDAEARPPRRVSTSAEHLVPQLIDEKRLDPRARAARLCSPPDLPRREVARRAAALRARRPARGGRRQHRQLRRGDVHRTGRHRQRRRPGRRVRRGDRRRRRAPVELRPRGGRRVRRRGRRGDAPGRDAGRASSTTAVGLAHDGTRAAIEAVCDAAATARRLARRRPRALRDGVRAVRHGRASDYRAARAWTPAARAGLQAIEELPVALGLLVLRPAATTPRRCSAASTTAATADSIASMGGALAGALGGVAARAAGLARAGRGRRAAIDLEEPGRVMAAVLTDLNLADERRATTVRAARAALFADGVPSVNGAAGAVPR